MQAVRLSHAKLRKRKELVGLALFLEPGRFICGDAHIDLCALALCILVNGPQLAGGAPAAQAATPAIPTPLTPLDGTLQHVIEKRVVRV